MRHTIEFSFENDLTFTIASDGASVAPAVGERVEFVDSDARMISGVVQRRTFRYDGDSCTVTLFIAY